jgi:tetratricopeptide (TPR) repeat protein
MPHGRLFAAGFALLLTSGWLLTSLAQPPAAPPVPVNDDEPTPDELRERAVMERFQGVLEKGPRKGTALDRLYGYHVERGSLDTFVATYRKQATDPQKAGTAWLIVGLLEAQRGRDADAATAYRAAEAADPANALIPYYLGQVLVLVGQPDAAAEAFERAITRKPNRTDLLDIFQALGRVYQRAQRSEKALGVWNRLEQMFPDDLRVQEQIASTLVEEGQYEQALPRLEKLVKKTEDRYRQATLIMEAADLKVRLKQTPKALADFEKLLSELDADSWLYKEVRRKIEEVYTRNDDQAGLAKYYDEWLKKNPQDIEAYARLAKTLTTQGRLPEAKATLEKALPLAPSRRDLRQALIEQLLQEGKSAEAAAQYEALAKSDPNNSDIIRDWGKVLYRDQSKPEAERKAAAVAIWKKLIEKKPKDPLAHTQLADLLRQSGAADDALALYRKAVELAPNSPQYREYLGEFLHTLQRGDEAKAAWAPIAEGANKNAKNLARLAEVLAGFGYRAEALAKITEALALEKDDLNLLIKSADLYAQNEKYTEAEKQLLAAFKLATNAEERETVLQEELKLYLATDTLLIRTQKLKEELDAGTDATADRYARLARYYESARLMADATQAIDQAEKKDPKSVPILSAAARIHEGGGNLLLAANLYRRLAAIDRRLRTDYLANVAKLEARLGRKAEALQAGRDLLAAAPGNPDNYKFFAELCAQLGEADEALESLRRSVRANPAEPQGLLTLAAALVDRQRLGEAIELYWRAFDKSDELDNKLSIIGRLTELYMQMNQFDKLVERLERERREADKQREMTLCLAQAYQSAGDLGTARQQLERLLTENPRDTQLLGQLANLSENEGDTLMALKFQRLLEKAKPNDRDAQLRLAQMLVRNGDSDEAAEIWVKLVAGEPEPHRNLQSIDQLIANQKYETALAILSRLLSQKPNQWEFLYREGMVLAAMNQHADALKRFTAILDLKLSDDELSSAEKHRRKTGGKAKAGTSGPSMNTPSVYEQERVPVMQRSYNAWSIRAATGLEPRYYYYSMQREVWVPTDYGAARMACLGWHMAAALRQGKIDDYLKQLRTTAQGADERGKWDYYYAQALQQNPRDQFESCKLLANTKNPAGHFVFLLALSNRTQTDRYSRARSITAKDTTPPLPPEQLTQVLSSYELLKRQKPNWVTFNVLQNVLTELKRAKRTDDEQKIYQAALNDTLQVGTIQQLLNVCAERGDLDNLLKLFAKLEVLQGGANAKGSYGEPPTRAAISPLMRAMSYLAAQKQYEGTFKLFEMYLGVHRRARLAEANQLGGSKKSSANNQNTYYMIWNGQYGRNYGIDFPAVNEYYDRGCIALLRTSFELYKKDDLISDFFSLLQKRLADAPATEKLEYQLAMGYAHWWNEDKDQGLNELVAASDLVPADLGMRISLADLRAKNNEPAEALALLDSIVPLDHQMMQRRERMALRFAEQSGNVERQRQAAERLFGLRLDAETQAELAGKMHKLGMHQAAETILARAQRQAGNRTNALVQLMQQYQGTNQGDLAVQLALQILRKGPSTSNAPYRGYDEGDGARRQAMQILNRSGKLKELIERGEAQMKVSPKSQQLLQTLLDYYEAAGEKEKQKSVVQKMAEIRPDDAKLRFQVANQLSRLGEHVAAVEHYKVALRKEPSLFSSRYWEIQRSFQEAQKGDDLTALFEELDLRTLGTNYWMILEQIEPMLANDKTRHQGLKLFKKAWTAYPEQRQWMLQSIDNPDVWALPDLYQYTKEAVFPQDDGPAEPWRGCDNFIGYSDGRASGMVTRLLEVARRQNKLDVLARETQVVVSKRPEWAGGKALLAILDIQRGRAEAGRKVWMELLADEKTPMPYRTRFILGFELEYYSSVEDLMLKTLEGGIEECLAEGENDFSNSPLRRLCMIYRQLDREDDAHKLALKSLKMSDANYDVGYQAYRRINTVSSVARELQEMGRPVEAVRLVSDLLNQRDLFDSATAMYGNDMTQQAEAILRQCLKQVKPSQLPTAVRDLLAPRLTESKSNQPQAVLDLIRFIETSKDGKNVKLTSMFATAIDATKKFSDLRAGALAQLSDLVRKHPDDLSVRVALALAAFADDKPDQAVTDLATFVAAHPLETLPAKVKANARQRSAANPFIDLWLVARQCLPKSELRAAGLKLGEQGLAAAKRQKDNRFALAILRDWTQIELDRKDPAAAEVRMRQMLEHVLPPPTAKPVAKPAVAPAPGGPIAVPAVPILPAVPKPAPLDGEEASEQTPAPAVPVPAKGPAPAAVTAAPVVSFAQFRDALEIAKAAADKGLAKLSLQAVQQALRGGPPVPTDADNRRSRRLTYNPSGNYYYYEDGDARGSIEPSMRDLVERWRQIKVPLSDIFDVLVEAIMPASRPGDVFLYFQQTGNRYPGQQAELVTRSLGRLVAELAVEAKLTDPFKTRLLEREQQPTAAVNARIMLAELAVAQNDVPAITAQFQKLVEALDKDTTAATAETIYPVALACLSRPEYSALARPVVEKAVKNLGTGNGAAAPLQEMWSLLIRSAVERKDDKAVADYLKEMEAQSNREGRYDGNGSVAREYLLAKRPADALRLLGPAGDAQTGRGKGNEALPGVLVALSRALAPLPPIGQYELWKKWTLPTEGKNALRVQIALRPPPLLPPAEFKPDAPVPVVVSTPDLLLNAAKAAGKLDELVAELSKLDAKTENATFVLALAKLAADDPAPLEKLLAEREKETLKDLGKPIEQAQSGRRYYGNRGDEDGRRPAVLVTDFLLARTALFHPKLAGPGRHYAAMLQQQAAEAGNSDISARLREDLLTTANTQRPTASGLTRWQATAGSWWSLVGPTLGHVMGMGNVPSSLYFAAPLTGTFDFSVEVYNGSQGGGQLVVNGLCYDIPRAQISDEGHSNSRYKQLPGLVWTDDFNRVRVSVTPKTVRVSINDQLLFEDPAPTTTSPWLALRAGGNEQTAFRNFQLNGTPTVPKTVQLLTDNRMDGWQGGAQPRRDLGPNEGYEEDEEFRQARTKVVYDWEARNGELIGRRATERSPRPLPAILSYARPLFVGETLSYEYWYEPGRVEVRPVLGQLGFVFDPAGVKLQWLGQVNEDGHDRPDQWHNIIAVPAERKGAVTLKANEWNAVQMKVLADRVQLTLNGTLVYERALPTNAERRFAFLHFQEQTSVRVRKIELTGAWPTSVTGADIVPTLQEPTQNELGRRVALGEMFLSQEVGPLLERVAKLPPAERYAQLRAWVLADPPQLFGALQAGPTGGMIVAPALELASAAKAANQLDELVQAVQKMPAGPERSALTVVALVAKGETPPAQAELQRLLDGLKTRPTHVPAWQRWPEVIAALGAVSNPQLHGQAVQLLDGLATPLMPNPDAKILFPGREQWERIVNVARGQALAAPQATVPALWANVPLPRAAARGGNFGPARWTVQAGVIEHVPGHDRDFLQLRVPLRGNFVVAGEFSPLAGAAVRLSYAGLRVEIAADRKSYSLWSLDRRVRTTLLEPPLDEPGEWAKVKLIVQDGTWSLSVNERKLLDEPLAATADPWLALYADAATVGKVRNLAITGSPEVLTQVDLSSHYNLSAWANYYSAGLTDSEWTWTKRGEEIYSQAYRQPPTDERVNIPRTYSEDVLYYHRPLREDGTISYDFYYHPDKACTHPALDRLALVLAPNGVKLHTITDASNERTGRMPDALTDEPEYRKGPGKLPLKAKAWNKVELQIKGDTLSLTLNGTLVYERPIPKENQRFFGLFHYTDDCEVRVRQVVYRGAWPTALPPADTLLK